MLNNPRLVLFGLVFLATTWTGMASAQIVPATLQTGEQVSVAFYSDLGDGSFHGGFNTAVNGYTQSFTGGDPIDTGGSRPSEAFRTGSSATFVGQLNTYEFLGHGVTIPIAYQVTFTLTNTDIGVPGAQFVLNIGTGTAEGQSYFLTSDAFFNPIFLGPFNPLNQAELVIHGLTLADPGQQFVSYVPVTSTFFTSVGQLTVNMSVDPATDDITLLIADWQGDQGDFGQNAYKLGYFTSSPVSVVPEPANAALVCALGAGGLAWWRRRKGANEGREKRSGNFF